MPRSRRTPLVLLALALALTTACGQIWSRPPPEGESVVLETADLTATWTDADSGGTLTLKPDGTFTADRVCGDWLGATGLSDEGPRSGPGTWKEHSDKEGTQVYLTLDAKGPDGEEGQGFDALRRGTTLLLWTTVTEDDPHCILTRDR